MEMFCRDCEQTIGGKACTSMGACGKTPDVSALQILLIHCLKGIGIYGNLARELGIKDSKADKFIIEALFTTVTNVDFDQDRIKAVILESIAVKDSIKKQFLTVYKKNNGSEYAGKLSKTADFVPENTVAKMLDQVKKLELARGGAANEDIVSMKELILSGMKGMAAYADHALVLGVQDETVNAFLYKGLNAIADDSLQLNDLITISMELGKVNFKCMEMLDNAHTTHFGNPVPTSVFLGIKEGPAIIVSGHDLYDLEQLLEQSDGKGVNIYTHGEMLPAHGYPKLKKYTHLVANFGTAWQNQQKEFANIPAAILMTTNCIQKPADSYKDRIFTTGLVAWPDVAHIKSVNGKKDFSQVINKAVSLGGFKADKEDKTILVGFGHNAILSVADKVIEAVKSGSLKHIFLIGGCDGAKPGRNYYTEFAEKVPKDCLVMTLACGKFRFNRHDFGTLGGLPRLLDIGQCNDAYSAIKVASALAAVFKTDVNGLPLSLILSWYEQKAVCILLTLLSLGIKNIKLGPTLPAFVSPNVLKFLVENFNIKPISTAEADLGEILGTKVK